jgi:hypothetical protein
MSPGPDMPTPGSGLVNTLGNALAQAVGYATSNPQLQQQAISRQEQDGRMRLLAPVGQAFGEAQAKLATGDLAGANAAYQKIAHLGMAYPAIQHFGTQLAERSLGIENRRRLAAAAGQPDYVAGETAPAKPGELTAQLQPGEDEEAAALIPRTQGEPAKTSILDNRQNKLAQLVALGVDPDKATKMVYPDFHTVTLDDGSVAIVNPRTGQLARAYQGMGKPVQPSESLVTNGPQGPQTAYTAPPKLGIPDTLATFLSPTEQAIYAKGLQDRTPDGLRLADAMYAKAQEQYFASKAPDARKAAAQDLGMSRADIAAMEGGTLDPVKSQRVTQRLIQLDEIKKADELVQLKAINMASDPASKAFPSYKAYVDEKGNVVDAGGINAQTARDNMAAKRWAGLDTDQLHRYQLMSNLTPQLQAAKDNIARLYAGVTPGANLGNALSLYARQFGGDGAVRLQDALNIDLAGEQGRILMGSSRVPVSTFNRYLEHGTSNKTDTVESSLAKITLVENLQQSSRANLANRTPIATVDPYRTNPILRDLDTLRQQGKHPVLSVDRQGQYTIVVQ